jgi:hypothetical protein
MPAIMEISQAHLIHAEQVQDSSVNVARMKARADRFEP